MFNKLKDSIYVLFKKQPKEKLTLKVEREENWSNSPVEKTSQEDLSYDEVPDVYRSVGLFLDQLHPYVIMAGPFKNKPFNVRGLCLDETYYFDNNDWLYHIEDFSVPDNKGRFEDILKEVHKYGCAEKIIYVGCKGGRGRTGLCLACLLKTLGADDPITLVRSYYDRQAIETKEQEDFINNF